MKILNDTIEKNEMITIKETDNSITFEKIKPIIFDYAHPQKTDDFKEVSYDYRDDMNKIDGKTVIECSQIQSISLTKTKVKRESDDSPIDDSMFLVTKTSTQRETDDTPHQELMYATTKTFVERESDDSDASATYMFLLTKTNTSRESDE